MLCVNITHTMESNDDENKVKYELKLFRYNILFFSFSLFLSAAITMFCCVYLYKFCTLSLSIFQLCV